MFSPEAGTAVPGRKPGDYFRWLKVCGGCLRVLLRSGRTRAPHGPKGRLRALLGSPYRRRFFPSRREAA